MGSDIAQDARREAIVASIPASYSPVLHLVVPTSIGLGILIAAVLSLRDVSALELVTVPLTILFGFAFEWRAHKHVLHARRPFVEVLYERHELMHHVIFTSTDLAMRSPRELWLILMPPYAVLLVFAMVLPVAGFVGLLATWNTALLMVATSMVFFLSYEWLHLAYHLPRKSRVGRAALIAHLREFHRQHHDPRRMKRWNFNVTVPLFDWIHGTLWSPKHDDSSDE